MLVLLLWWAAGASAGWVRLPAAMSGHVAAVGRMTDLCAR